MTAHCSRVGQGLMPLPCKALLAAGGLLEPRSGDEGSLYPLRVVEAPLDHAIEVAQRLRERRDAAETLDVPLAGVIGGQGHLLIPEPIEQVAKVFGAGSDVLLRAKEISITHQPPRLRHDLHETLRVLARGQLRTEVAFRFDD